MTAPLWTAEEARAATGGVLEGDDWQATGVSIDTRTLLPGDLFVALTAARDGHDFVANALAKGAAAALVSRRPEGVTEDARLLVVGDVQKGLEALGIAARERTAAQIIAVTGSAGKTSTKEMLKAVFEGQGPTHAAAASYNNHWGVPLTLARMPADTRYAIIEIGMNHPGEIAPLSKMARPHVAVITTVAAAHLEAFDDVSGIAHEKAAIMEGLEAGGFAILPGDNEFFPILEGVARDHGARVVTFGEGKRNHHRLLTVDMNHTSTAASARVWRTPVMFKVGATGVHFALNALAVLAAVRATGADRAEAMCALGQWSAPGGRGHREIVVLDPVADDMTVELIDDAFNANPASLDAALRVLALARPQDGVGRFAKGRRVAVLGDMLELGPTEEALHRAIADHPAMEGIAKVHCVGPRMKALYDALPAEKRGQWAETAEPLAQKAAALADAGDIVLVKGSKASKVSLIVDAIRKLGHPPADTT